MREFILHSFAAIILYSSVVFSQTPSPSPSPTIDERTRPGELRLTRIDSITENLASKRYFYLKEEGFRIQLPANFSNYMPSKTASATGNGNDGHISWNLPEAELNITFGDMDAKEFATLTAEQRLGILAASLAAMTGKGGVTKIYDRDIKVGSIPAKESKFKIGDKGYLARALFSGARLFAFVAYPHNVEKAEDILKQSLDTFEPLERPTAQPPTAGVSSTEVLENGIFRSSSGRFSIAIPDLPKQTIDKSTEKAKTKGIDAGRQFVWIIGRTLYTLYYNPPFDNDGNPSPQVYVDMENGTRKGILNSGAKLLSEKAITLGKYRGTEFRYSISNGVQYINRVVLVGDFGYQIVGGYADQKDERAVKAVLDSFKPITP